MATVTSSFRPETRTRQTDDQPTGPFLRRDWIAAAVVFVTALLVYVLTLAPNVTMEDSGELIIGATLFGVPHPPGYPLFSMLGYIFTSLFPVGNYAWRMNLVSAIYGAGAVSVTTLLLCHSGRWLLQALDFEKPELRGYVAFYGGIAGGLILAFSWVMWTQSVVAEVYTLNALLLMGVLLCFYRWMLEPDRMGWLYGSVFVFALGLTNHHTLLALMPAFLLGVALRRWSFFWSFLVAVSLMALSALAVLVWFSDKETLHAITVRWAYVIFSGIGLLSLWYTSRISWQWLAGGAAAVAAVWAVGIYGIGGWFDITSDFGSVLPLFGLALVAGALLANSLLDRKSIVIILALGWVGLMPYAYMPLASSTNPPMNWAFTQDNDGFFHAVTRGQYTNNLSSWITKTAWLVGGNPEAPVAGPTDRAQILGQVEHAIRIYHSILYYSDSVLENFTFPVAACAIVWMFFVRQLSPARRAWLYFLLAAFVMLALFMLVIDAPGRLDMEGSWFRKVFDLQSHCVFALAIAYGLMAAVAWLHESLEDFPPYLCAGLLLTALIPLTQNYAKSSQRGHWFGWQYGYDILKPLPKNAVLFGGTDAGRFVPTYMIFGESQMPARYKRDPDFDRRDVFIITQNSMASSFYLRHIAHHYDERFRPKQFSAFEKFLGRDTQYPKQSLILPTQADLDAAALQMERLYRSRIILGQPNPIDRLSDTFHFNGLVAWQVFERNKDEHEFYVQESIPIEWMMDYLVPDGLIMRLERHEVTEMPQEIIDRDREFWDGYSARLRANPLLPYDLVARRSFAKLRTSIGNLYRHHGLPDEAEYAFRQSLSFAPTDTFSVLELARLLRSQDRYDEIEQMLTAALEVDPHNVIFADMLADVGRSRKLLREKELFSQTLEKTPQRYSMYQLLAQTLVQLDREEELMPIFRQGSALEGLPHEMFRGFLDLLKRRERFDDVLELLEIRAEALPKDVTIIYNLSANYAARGRRDEALDYLGRSLDLDPAKTVQLFSGDIRFQEYRNDPDFQKLLKKSRPLKPVETNQPNESAESATPVEGKTN